MDTVTKRELNQETASVLARVAAGGDVAVTERGTVRWRLSRFDGTPSGALDRLAEEGRYTPPSSTPAPWPEQAGGRRYTGAEVDALLEDVRGDR